MKTLLAKLKAKIVAAYHFVVDHLTKVLGAIGLAVTAIDPVAVQGASTTYLGDNAQRKIGVGLFGLVIARGWYTGVKAKASAKPPTAP